MTPLISFDRTQQYIVTVAWTPHRYAQYCDTYIGEPGPIAFECDPVPLGRALELAEHYSSMGHSVTLEAA